MRFYRHRILETLFISPALDNPQQAMLATGIQAGQGRVEMYVRQSPEQGCPERECGRLAVHPTMVQAYLTEMSREAAIGLDAALVHYVSGLYAPFQLQWALPRGAKLVLVDVGACEDGHLFDVYRKRDLFQRPRTQRQGFHLSPLPMVYLNPLLARILPTRRCDGAERILVPFSAQDIRCDCLLVLALAVQIWGGRAQTAYQYEVAYL